MQFRVKSRFACEGNFNLQFNSNLCFIFPTQLPADLKSVLEKEWWNSKLLQLTQKQNEYVTHPELRQPSFPLYTNSSAQSGNNTLLGRKQINGSQVLTNLTSSQGFINQSSILQGTYIILSLRFPIIYLFSVSSTERRLNQFLSEAILQVRIYCRLLVMRRERKLLHNPKKSN